MSIDDKNDLLLIQKTIDDYCKGVITGNYSCVKKAWHMEGNRILVQQEPEKIVFQNSPASKEYSNYVPNPEVTQSAEIESIDKTGIAASVRLKWKIESPKWKKTSIDYCLLLKEKSKWIIVSKISYKD